MLALALITVLALARVWIGFAQSHRAERADVEERAAQHAQALAAVTAHSYRNRFESLDRTLHQLVLAAKNRGRIDEVELGLARQSQPPGFLLSIRHINAKGYVVEARRGERGSYLGDQPFFQHHASTPSAILQVDPPTLSKIDGGWVIPVSRAIHDQDGRFAGAVVLSLSPEEISAELRSFDLGPTDVVGLIHRDGSYLARSFRLSDALGQKVHEDRFNLRGGNSDSGVFRGQGRADGIDRVWAYRRLAGLDLIAIVGIDLAVPASSMRDRHQAEFDHTTLGTVIVLTLLGAMLALLWRLDATIHDLRSSEERLKTALEGASEVAWVWHSSSDRVLLLGNCQRFFGVTEASVEIDLHAWRDRVHPADRPRVRDAWVAHLAGETKAFEVEYRVLGEGSGYRWALVRGATKERDELGRAERVTGVLIDIDPIKQAQLTITRLTDRYQQLFAAANEGIYVVNAMGEIEMMNKAAQRLTGWREEEVRGKHAHTLFHEALSAHPEHSWSTCPLNLAMKTGLVRTGERVIYWRHDGSAMPVELSIGPLRQADENDGAIVVFTDITERLATERQLEMLATTDELTGLANRRHFVEVAERDLARATRDRLRSSLLMMDLDHFKTINDRFGHATGDSVLRTVTLACSAQLRTVDIFGRLGGEEFAVLLANVEPQRAVEVAERMRVAASEQVVEAGETRVAVTVSLGVAHARSGESLDSLLARADRALYRAKENGRNQVCIAEPISQTGEACST